MPPRAHRCDRDDRGCVPSAARPMQARAAAPPPSGVTASATTRHMHTSLQVVADMKSGICLGGWLHRCVLPSLSHPYPIPILSLSHPYPIPIPSLSHPARVSVLSCPIPTPISPRPIPDPIPVPVSIPTPPHPYPIPIPSLSHIPIPWCFSTPPAWNRPEPDAPGGGSCLLACTFIVKIFCLLFVKTVPA